jgi:hypothetical protein
MGGYFSDIALDSYRRLVIELQGADFAEGETYDFTRCVKPDGTVYGTAGQCRRGTEEAKGEAPPKVRGMRVGKTVKSLSVGDLEKLLGDPRVKPHQAAKIQKLIDEKKGSETSPKPKAETKPKVAEKPKAEAKKASDPVKDADREQYNALLEKSRKAAGISSRIKSDIEKETGKAVSPTSPNWKEYTTRLKAEKLTPKKVSDLSVAVRNFRKAEGRGWLDKELQAADVAKNNAAWKSIPRDERKAAIQARVERSAKREKSLFELSIEIKDWGRFIKSTPELNTPENRTAMIAMRALRAKLFMGEKSEREAKAKAYQKLVEGSPKYKEVPGSTKPIRKMSTEEIVKELRKAENDYVTRAQDFDKRGKTFEANLERRKANDADYFAGKYLRGLSRNPPLDFIYRLQGYDARPEVVSSRKDLENRDDLVKGNDGKALVLWRGVTSVEFADQFKGAGPRGDVHYPGSGIYGNGTYAASESPGTSNRRSALKEAESYTGWGDENKDRRITAFGIRKDANILQFEGKDWVERGGKFNDWKKGVIKKAEDETGRVFHDIGEAAAALGVHAYRVPQGRDEDFWVILNRGALVVAADPQMEDY